MLDLLQAQLARNEALIADVGPGQYHLPTPCARFDTRSLVNHMVLANHFFVAVASGQHMEDPGDDMSDVLGEDPLAAHRQSVAELTKILTEPGTLDRTFDFGFAQMPAEAGLGLMLTETTAHGWDLAKALGRDTTIDPALAVMLLEGAAGIDGIRNPDGNPFGPAVTPAESASPGDRLMAFLGRTP